MRKREKITSVCISLLFVLSAICHADALPSLTVGKPLIDGDIEEIWRSGIIFDSFVQIEPELLAESAVQSEFFFLYDHECIYLAARLYQDRNTIRSNRGRKDSDIILEGDYVSFVIDAMNNGNTAYYFTVNPSNGLADGNLLRDGEWVNEWDCPVNAKTSIADEGWSIELEIPLSTINFQDGDIQDWGILFLRHYAENGERSVNQLPDINDPFKISEFYKIRGLTGLSKGSALSVTPYVYSIGETSDRPEPNDLDLKTGIDMKYSPKSSLLISGTADPDYAQLETDREIINVSDLPTEYPEKRPFFIESSEFYPGSSVNTRNIVDIEYGAKIKKLGRLLSYDVTGVRDGSRDLWLLSNVRLADGARYLFQVVEGLKYGKDRHDFNITANFVKYYVNGKMWHSSWVDMLDGSVSDDREWETVNSIRWKSRTIYTGFWSQLKTEYYNPHVVGWNYISNEIVFHVWFNYSLIRESGFLRNATLELHANQYDLFTDRGNEQYMHYAELDCFFYMGSTLGTWNAAAIYSPPSGQKFRYREVDSAGVETVFRDAIGEFRLIDAPAEHMMFEILTDRSRVLGGRLFFSNEPVRGSGADYVNGETWLKLGSSTIVSYEFAQMDIDGSPHQSRYRQAINRVKVEYNITDRFNLRTVWQSNSIDDSGTGGVERRGSCINAVLSWMYSHGGYLYLVFNRRRNEETYLLPGNEASSIDQMIALKVNRTFSL